MNNVSFFSKNLKWIRSYYNLSQEALASSLGIKRNNIASYESGNSSPGLQRAIAIARYFNVSLEIMVLTDFDVIEPKIGRKLLKAEQIDVLLKRKNKKLDTWKVQRDLMETLLTGYNAMLVLDPDKNEDFAFGHIESMRLIRILEKNKLMLDQMLDFMEEEM